MKAVLDVGGHMDCLISHHLTTIIPFKILALDITKFGNYREFLPWDDPFIDYTPDDLFGLAIT